MTLVDRLRKYNAWRRGKTDDPQPHPKQIGKDIDEAIAKLAAAEMLAEAVGQAVEVTVTPISGPYLQSNFSVTPADFPTIKEALTAYQSQTKEQDDERTKG